MSSSCQEPSAAMTVELAMSHWLDTMRGEVREITWKGYKQVSTNVVGPLLVGSKNDRFNWSCYGVKRADAQFIQMLGPVEIRNLKTAQIRNWHKVVTAQVSHHTANVAKKFLRAALCLAAEDFLVPIPPMPTRIGRGQTRPKKLILSLEQVGRLLDAALSDDRGIYYAFPFLTGVRPSEQLALLWSDTHLEDGFIRIRRAQQPDGTVTNFTKTDAGMRDIPICPLLRSMLDKWQSLCPKVNGHEPRVFPLLGRRGFKHHPKIGYPLAYTNFLYTYWRPALASQQLPIVTPHSARHTFISTLQAQGIEVGLVAKLVGHANATVTLTHYTQAVRGGAAALAMLQNAYAKDGCSR